VLSRRWVPQSQFLILTVIFPNSHQAIARERNTRADLVVQWGIDQFRGSANRIELNRVEVGPTLENEAEIGLSGKGVAKVKLDEIWTVYFGAPTLGCASEP
jgi:hypothetical protein